MVHSVDSVISRAEQLYQEYIAFFPSSMHDDELERKLRLKAITNAENVRTISPSRQHQDISSISNVLNSLPGTFAAQVQQFQQKKLDILQLNLGVLTQDAVRWLSSQLSPLDQNGEVPEARDLSSWWVGTTRAVEQLHTSIKTSALNAAGIRTIAPYILGDVSWTLVSTYFRDHHGWSDFRDLVDKKFGKSLTKLKRAFKLEQPRPDESAPAFIKRMDTRRAQLQCSGEECFTAFFDRLDCQFIAHCELMRSTRATLGSDELTWELLVDIAEDKLSGASVLNMRPRVQTQPSAQDFPMLPDPMGTSPTSEPNTKPPIKVLTRPNQCSLCTELGRDSVNHKLEFCYLNPKGKAFKQEDYDKKITYLKRNNLPIPSTMQSFPPAPSTPPAKAPEQAYQTQQKAVTEFERFIRNIGLSEEAISKCMSIYSHNEQKPATQHMFFEWEERDDEDSNSNPNFQATSTPTILEQLIAGNPSNQTPPDAQGQTPRDQIPQNRKSAKQETIQQLLAVVKQVQELVANVEDDQDEEMESGDKAPKNLTKFFVDGETNTGGVQDAGRVIRLGQGKPPAARAEPDLNKIVQRLRHSIPLVRATLTDIHLRNFVLAMMVAQNVKDNRPIVLPDGALAHLVNAETFEAYKATLGGINSSNVDQVEERLAELGIDGRGQVLLNKKKQVKRKQEQNNAVIGQLETLMATLQGLDAKDIGDSGKPQMMAHALPQNDSTNKFPDKKGLPKWASKGAVNAQGMMEWNNSMYVITVQIDQAVIQAMLDTGGYVTMLDIESAKQMGLNYEEAVNGNLGHYYSPGYKPVAYAGVVHGPVELRFSESVVVTIPYIKLIHSDRRLAILGVDFLCGGRPYQRWNFHGLPVYTKSDGEVIGAAVFRKGNEEVEIPLENVPKVRPILQERQFQSSQGGPKEPRDVTFGPVYTRYIDKEKDGYSTDELFHRLYELLQDMHQGMMKEGQTAAGQPSGRCL